MEINNCQENQEENNNNPIQDHPSTVPPIIPPPHDDAISLIVGPCSVNCTNLIGYCPLLSCRECACSFHLECLGSQDDEEIIICHDCQFHLCCTRLSDEYNFIHGYNQQDHGFPSRIPTKPALISPNSSTSYVLAILEADNDVVDGSCCDIIRSEDDHNDDPVNNSPNDSSNSNITKRSLITHLKYAKFTMRIESETCLQVIETDPGVKKVIFPPNVVINATKFIVDSQSDKSLENLIEKPLNWIPQSIVSINSKRFIAVPTGVKKSTIRRARRQRNIKTCNSVVRKKGVPLPHIPEIDKIIPLSLNHRQKRSENQNQQQRKPRIRQQRKPGTQQERKSKMQQLRNSKTQLQSNQDNFQNPTAVPSSAASTNQDQISITSLLAQPQPEMSQLISNDSLEFNLKSHFAQFEQPPFIQSLITQQGQNQPQLFNPSAPSILNGPTHIHENNKKNISFLNSRFLSKDQLDLYLPILPGCKTIQDRQLGSGNQYCNSIQNMPEFYQNNLPPIQPETLPVRSTPLSVEHIQPDEPSLSFGRLRLNSNHCTLEQMSLNKNQNFTQPPRLVRPPQPQSQTYYKTFAVPQPKFIQNQPNFETSRAPNVPAQNNYPTIPQTHTQYIQYIASSNQPPLQCNSATCRDPACYFGQANGTTSPRHQPRVTDPQFQVVRPNMNQPQFSPVPSFQDQSQFLETVESQYQRLYCNQTTTSAQGLNNRNHQGFVQDQPQFIEPYHISNPPQIIQSRISNVFIQSETNHLTVQGQSEFNQRPAHIIPNQSFQPTDVGNYNQFEQPLPQHYNYQANQHHNSSERNNLIQPLTSGIQVRTGSTPQFRYSTLPAQPQSHESLPPNNGHPQYVRIFSPDFQNQPRIENSITPNEYQLISPHLILQSGIKYSQPRVAEIQPQQRFVQQTSSSSSYYQNHHNPQPPTYNQHYQSNNFQQTINNGNGMSLNNANLSIGHPTNPHRSNRRRRHTLRDVYMGSASILPDIIEISDEEPNCNHYIEVGTAEVQNNQATSHTFPSFATTFAMNGVQGLVQHQSIENEAYNPNFHLQLQSQSPSIGH